MQSRANTSAKENHNSVATGQSGTAQNLMATNTAVRMNAESINRDRNLLNEAGADLADEQGLGEEEVMVVEGAESAGEGLFGGAIAGSLGGGPLAAAGLAGLGIAGSNDTPGVSGLPIGDGNVGPIQVARADSAGVNIGPSDDGSVLISGEKTEVALLRSPTPNATINKLSVLNPEAPLPSGNPVSIDPETQVVGLNLGPLAQTELDLTVDTLPTTLLGLVGDLSSGNIALDQLVALDIPTSIAGTDVPLTATLNEGLTQLDSALSPITDALQSAIAGSDNSGFIASLTNGLNTLGTLPVIGDITSQLDSAVEGGLPTGTLPFSIPTDTVVIPQTGTPLDLATGLISSGITSASQGDLSALNTVTNLVA